MAQIKLRKDNEIASNIITMFSIISEATSKKDIEVKENEIHISQKEEGEIFKFDEKNINQLKKRIFVDFFQNPSVHILTLTEEESELFLRCSHAAYYFETERNKVGNKGLRDKFLKYHEQNFKQH